MTGGAPDARGGRVRRALRRPVARALLAVAVAALAVVLLVRLVDSSALPVLVAVEASARWLLIAAWPLLVLTLLGRLRLLGAVAAALSLAQLVLLGQAFVLGGDRSAADPRAVLQLTTANILLDNDRPQALAAALADDDSDVVLLQEVTPAVRDALRATPLWSAYPYRVDAARDGYGGQLLLSRLPLTETGSALPAALDGAATAAVVETAAGPVELVGVHLAAPITPQNLAAWQAQLEALGTLRETAADAPLVIAGDFNATLDHAPFRALLDGRDGGTASTDVFSAVGSGFGFSWPAWAGPALLRIDHILVGAAVEPLTVQTRPTPGSDHLRVVGALEIVPSDALESPR